MADETGGGAPPAAAPSVTADAPSEAAKPEVTATEPPKDPPKEPPVEAAEEPEEGEDKPRRPNQRERMRRRMMAMQSEMDAMRSRLEVQESKKEPDTGPKEQDFNGDTFAYLAAKSAFDARQAVRAEFQERDQRDTAAEAAKRTREATEEYFERVEEVKPRIPDFDKVVEGFYANGGRFAPHLVEELRENDRGPELTYYLAKHPGIAMELNSLSPRDATREIARLERKVEMPKPKTQTQAPPPLITPTGGASPARDLMALAKSEDISAYVAERRRQDKKD